jgi:membrane protein required for colicin V production
MAWGVILDCVVIAVILVSSIIAFLRGFIREVLTILGVVGGLIAAYFIGPSLAPVFLNWITGPDAAEDAKCIKEMVPCDALADILSYGSIFILVVLILSIVSHFLSASAKAVGLGAVDRTFGVLFGIARGVALMGLLYLPFYLMADKEDRAKTFDGSTTLVYVEATSTFFADLIPESMSSEAGKKAQAKLDAMAESTRQKLKDMEVLKDEQRMSSGGSMAPGEVTGNPPPPVMPPESLPPADQAPPPSGFMPMNGSNQ